MAKMTMVRTLALLFALVNQALVLFGMSPLPFEQQEVEAFTATLFTVVTALWAWWKDNDITKAARDRKSKLQ